MTADSLKAARAEFDRKQAEDNLRKTTTVALSLAAPNLAAVNTKDQPLRIMLRLDRGERGTKEFLMAPVIRSTGRHSSGAVGGWQVRYDYEAGAGMGVIRYPLRKDGTIDVQRLRGDLDAWDKRETSRENWAAEKSRRITETANEYALVEKIAHGLSGAASGALYIEVQHDGSAEGRPVRIKISGHVGVHRALALLQAVEATKELQ